MQINRRTPSVFTHEGARASQISPYETLRRTTLSCLLWEDEFYENGEEIAERIARLAKVVDPQKVAELAVEACEDMNLRHAPLWLVRNLADHKDLPEGLLRATTTRVINRADSMSELLAMFVREGKVRAPHAVLRGVADALHKFNEYQLAKYDRPKAIKLRDVIRLTHPKPTTQEQANMWRRAISGDLKTPETWEVAISSIKKSDENAILARRAAWVQLLTSKRLGGLALLRNLRNMEQAGVDLALIREALFSMRFEKIFPYQFITAHKHVPMLEDALEACMFRAMESSMLRGRTSLVVDHSGSMHGARFDRAASLAVLLREICEDVRIFTFSDDFQEIPPRRGFGLYQSMHDNGYWMGTNLARVVDHVGSSIPCDRLIVITDEQVMGAVDFPVGPKTYVMNVVPYERGISYGRVIHMSGWSASVIRFIQELERLPAT